MKNLTLFTVVFICLIGCVTEKKMNFEDNTFNFEAADAYFKLIERLKLNGKIDSLEWTAFLDLKGNKLYIEENGIPKEFGENLKIMLEQVYTSSDSLNEAKSEDFLYKSRVLYKDKEQNYKNHFKWLKKNQLALKDSIVSRTKMFLPSNQKMKDTFPIVYYHGLDFDGSANSKGIFISIMATYDNNKKRLGNFEAHELHHLQRKSLLSNVEIANNDKGVIWALDAALNEGLADMVDKDVLLSDESDWWLKDIVMEFYIGRSKEVITNLDKLIREELEGIHHSEDNYRNILLGSVGHVPGYWMAKFIADNDRSNYLIRMADSPFYFFILYNEIATSKNESYPVFSASSIQYIKKLEKKYVTSRLNNG